MMKQEKEKLYIKTLIWAFDKHQNGFTLDELRMSIGLGDDDWVWWREMFITTNGNDRKLIDLYRRDVDGSFDRYTLNDKGMAIVIDYIALQEARLSGRRALWFAGVSIFFGVVTLLIAGWTGWVENQNLQIAVEPQVSFYLQRAGEGIEEYVFGIENDGVVPITEITAVLANADIPRDAGVSDEFCAGLGAVDPVMFDKELLVSVIKPHEGRQAKIFLSSLGNPNQNGDSTKNIRAISITVKYHRSIDKRVEVVNMNYIVDGYQLYTLTEAKDVKSLQSFIGCFRKLTARHTLWNNKIYWNE